MSSCSSSWSDVQNVQLRPQPPIRKKRIQSLLVNLYLFILWSWFCLYKLYIIIFFFNNCRKCFFASSFVRISDIVTRYNFFSRQFILTICQCFFSILTFQFLFLLTQKMVADLITILNA